MTHNNTRIRVKLIARNLRDPADPAWRKQLDLSRFGPDGSGPVEFVLDPDERNYDWLVVYDEIPKLPVDTARPDGPARQSEALACPPQNTILVTSEPSTIKIYGRRYLAQFGHVLSGLEPWSLRHHPGAIHEQSSMVWYYGWNYDRPRKGAADFDKLANAPWPDKPHLISTICSAKQQRHTLHNQRYNFTHMLKSRLPELQIFGHGHSHIADKAEALDPYRYHLAIENHIADHHWTEKLADTFLGYCLPFYAGATKASDYFPEDALVEIDLARPDWSIGRIRDAIANDEFSARKAAIEEARARIIHEHNLFPNIARIISEQGKKHAAYIPSGPGVIHSRHALRKSSPWFAVSHLVEKFLLTRRSTKNQRRLVPPGSCKFPASDD